MLENAGRAMRSSGGPCQASDWMENALGTKKRKFTMAKCLPIRQESTPVPKNRVIQLTCHTRNDLYRRCDLEISLICLFFVLSVSYLSFRLFSVCIPSPSTSDITYLSHFIVWTLYKRLSMYRNCREDSAPHLHR